MIADLNPYPAIKDSGVPWLGEVPEHWEIVPLGRIGRLFKGNGGSKEDEAVAGIPCVRYGDLYTQHGYFIRSTRACVSSQRASGYTPIHYGDLLFAASGETINEIGKSAVNLLKEEARCGGDILILRPSRKAVPEFLGYASDSPASITQKACMGRGFTVVHLYGSQLKGLALPVPPLPEQNAIVRFLDHANHRLEKAIRAKQKTIQLLEEQKQVIIHRAVAGGCHTNWCTSPARAVLRPIKRPGFPDKMLLSLFRDFGVIPKDSRENKNVDVRDLALCQLVQPGDVVMNKMKAWQGSIAVSELEGIVSPDYMVLQFTGDHFVPKFYHYLLRSPTMVAEYRRHAYGVRPGQWRLMYPEFCRLRLPVPPREEQSEIAEAINTAIKDVDRAATTIRREIALLQEYRTRLIADVVTGKLDVREAAKGLLVPEQTGAWENSDCAAVPEEVMA